MSASGSRRHLSRVDIVAGAALAIVGSAALVAALGFDAESRLFPALASGCLALAGLATLGLGVSRPGESGTVVGRLGVAALAVFSIGVWAGLFGAGLGFVLPTFLLQIALLSLAGVRRLPFLLAVAAAVTGLAYVAFVVVLDVPLPASILPAALEGF
ncbi:MAG: tripartite tricarboxylate transporter TctB family protein [Pseudomonadota bacterium]